MKKTLSEDDSLLKDTPESLRLDVVTNIHQYQQETKAWRDKEIAIKVINSGDLVFRRRRQEKVGKLQAKWEGPFIVTKLRSKGSFELTDLEENDETLTHVSAEVDVCKYKMGHLVEVFNFIAS